MNALGERAKGEGWPAVQHSSKRGSGGSGGSGGSDGPPPPVSHLYPAPWVRTHAQPGVQ